MPRKPALPKPTPAELRAKLDAQIETAGLPAPAKEHLFMPKPAPSLGAAEKRRLWRFDLVWLDATRLVVEIEGGSWIGGRHVRGGGFRGDRAKYNAATLLGYRLLRVDYDDIHADRAINLIVEAYRLFSRLGAQDAAPALMGADEERMRGV